MTFIDLQNNTTADADDVMGNFRHVNFGSDLIPVDTDGDGVDAALDLGSTSFNWKDAYFSGNIVAYGQYRASGGTAEFSGGTVACPNNAWTAVKFKSELVATTGVNKTGILHSTSSNEERWDLQGAGVFIIIGQVTFVGNSTGIRGVGFRVVGSDQIRSCNIQTGVATNDNTIGFSGLIETSSSSTDIEMVVFQNSGGTLNIRKNSVSSASTTPTQGTTNIQIIRIA
jgi:hypothetical protein